MRDYTHLVEGESSQKDINVIYFNARSLLPKLDELRTLVEMKKPSIVRVVKTWLSEDFTDEEISISNYQIFCCNRNRHGGGVLIYSHISLSVSALLSGPNKLELLSILLSSPCSSNKHCITLLYHPPSAPVSFFDELCTALQIFKFGHVY